MIKDLMKDYTGSLASFQNPDRVHIKMKQKTKMKQRIAMEYPFVSFLQRKITILSFLKGSSFQLASLKFHKSIFFFPNLIVVCNSVHRNET